MSFSHDILHLTNEHDCFDGRIFNKELAALSKNYNCYLITKGNSDNMLVSLGKKLFSPGVYNNITLFPFSLIYKSIFIKVIRKFFPFIFYNFLVPLVIVRKFILLCKSNNIKPSVIHYHELSFSPIANLLKKHFKCKLIFDCHEFYFSYYFEKAFNYKNLKKSARTLLQLKDAVHNADAIISVTKNLDNIISLMSKTQKHIIVYNCSNFPIQEKQAKNNFDKLVLVHEGSLKFNRGLSLMLELFTDDYLREHIVLKIIGNLPEKELTYFREKKVTCSITDSMLEITGWVDYEKVHEHLIGDIGIIFFEKTFNAYFSMPNKLFNYINVGLPILSVQCAEVSDFILEHKIGVIVERNIDSIKKGLHELMANYNYYQQNIKIAQKSFAWENEKTKLLSLYEELLKSE